MPDLIERLRALNAQEYIALGRRWSRSASMAKYLIILFAAVSGCAQFSHLYSNGQPDLANWIGMVASVMGLVAGVLILEAEPDNASILANARRAIDEAEKAQQEADRLKQGTKEEAARQQEVLRHTEANVERLIHLFTAVDAMHSLIEQMVIHGQGSDEIENIRRMMETAERSIVLAHSFETRQEYTVCVFRAEPDQKSGKTVLQLKAHARAIKCDLDKARSWREGVGVAGAAYSRGNEIVVADLEAPQLRTLYRLPETRPDDVTRYRSIIAVPVWTDGESPNDGTPPWGVITATTDQPDHFRYEDRRNSDATRALASMVGFAVKMSKMRPAGPDAGPALQKNHVATKA
jgi:hypothetical protein